MRRRWRWLAAGGVVALAALAGTAFGSGLGHDPSVVRSVLIGHPAPALSGPTLSGAPLSRSALTGKVLLVTVWASWCPSCRGEAPVLDAAQRRYGGRGLQVVGIDMTDQASAARSFLAATGGDVFPSLFDPDATVAINWGTFGVPESYLVDRSGVVRAKVVGTVSAGWISSHVPTLLAAS